MTCCFRYKPEFWEERGCQFASETDFITLEDGTTWCGFHLPMHDAAGEASPKASWDDGKIDAFNQAVFRIIDAAIDAGDEDDRKANLTGVVFPGDVDFERYDKGHPFPAVRFRKAVFSGVAAFGAAAFSGNADFREVAFSGRADFGAAAFSGDADFDEAAFSGYAGFREATFSGDASFREAAFSGFAFFNKAAFSGYADFRDAAFSANADFFEAVFSENADFSGAAKMPGVGGRRYDMRLTGTPDADSAWQVEGEAVLPATPSRSTFQRINFSGATFGEAIDFNNRRFTDTTEFRSTIFKRAPKFHNAVLHQDTDFEGAEFRDVRSENAERNYRTLKLAMEKVRSRREEAMFFALEQRSLRHQPATPWMSKFVSWLYDKAAEYGQNFVLPLLWMTFISAAFVDVYYGVMHYTSGGNLQTM